MSKQSSYKIVGCIAIFICQAGMIGAKSTPPPGETYTASYPQNEFGAFPEEMYQVIIDPLHRTLLSAQIQSPVEKIYKHMGDTFEKGDILIQLNDTVYQNNVKKAEAALNKAQVELDGKKQLFHDNVASLFELKEAEANVATAKADLSVAERDLNATTIKAPYDGKVVTLNIEEHELPQTGKDLIEVVYDKTLLAKLLLPSSMLKDLKVGLPFTIDVNETKQRIQAKILRIGSVLDPSSSTIKIEAEIDNKDGKLKAGMTGKVNFQTDNHQTTEKTPASAMDLTPSTNPKT